jgi:hypothetical protein
MTLAEIQSELQAVTGKPWTDDADGARRQALWQRLDQLVAAEAVSGSETATLSPTTPSTPSPSPAPSTAPTTYDPALGTCRCPSEPARVPVPHAFRRHKVTGEFVLVPPSGSCDSALREGTKVV